MEMCGGEEGGEAKLLHRVSSRGLPAKRPGEYLSPITHSRDFYLSTYFYLLVLLSNHTSLQEHARQRSWAGCSVNSTQRSKTLPPRTTRPPPPPHYPPPKPPSPPPPSTHRHHAAAKGGNAVYAAALEKPAQYVATFSGGDCWMRDNHIKPKMTCSGVTITYHVRAVRSTWYDVLEAMLGAVSSNLQ